MGTAGALFTGAMVGCSQSAAPSQAAGVKTAVIELDRGGSITIQLFTDVASKTVQNFEQKANSQFYDGLTFWRVEGWVIQGGDPKGNGTGGNNIPIELNDKPFVAGSVGMARGADPRLHNDAQFFICKDPSPHLNKQFANFGQVTDGMEVVRGVRVGDKIKKISVKG